MDFRINRDGHVEFNNNGNWIRPTVLDMLAWSKEDVVTYAWLVTEVLNQHKGD
jgi:hypothetical protein